MNGLYKIPKSGQSGGITRYDEHTTLFSNDTLIVNQFGDGSEVEYWEDHTPHQPNQMWDRSFDDNAGFFTFKNQQFIYSMLSSTRPDKFIVAGMPNCILFDDSDDSGDSGNSGDSDKSGDSDDLAYRNVRDLQSCFSP